MAEKGVWCQTDRIGAAHADQTDWVERSRVLGREGPCCTGSQYGQNLCYKKTGTAARGISGLSPKMNTDLTNLLQDWPYEPGRLNVRLIYVDGNLDRFGPAGFFLYCGHFFERRYLGCRPVPDGLQRIVLLYA